MNAVPEFFLDCESSLRPPLLERGGSGVKSVSIVLGTGPPASGWQWLRQNSYFKFETGPHGHLSWLNDPYTAPTRNGVVQIDCVVPHWDTVKEQVGASSSSI